MTTRDGMASTTTTSFKIHGMDCAEEVTLLREVVGNVVGDSALSFDIVNGKMTVASEVSAERVLEAVARTGMRAEVWQDDRPGPSRHGTSWVRNGRTLFTLASGLLSLAGFIVHGLSAGEPSVALGSEGLGIAHHVPVASKVLFILGILAGTRYVLPKAWFALKRLRPDMNLLMTIAVVGAVVIGEWFEAATVTFLFALSLALESWSVGRARRAVEALLDLSSPSARLKRVDGSEELVRLEAVSVGNRFVVMPGERIPLDGQVLSGASEVNQAPITGESMPTPKAVGDTVFAGTINGNGELEVECTKTAGDTTLAHIVRMVGEAQAHRSPSEQWVERFARIYTPVVMALALAVLLLPPLFIDGMWSIWSYRGLVLLVIACPCALVISTPVSIVAALAASAHHGVLVKSGVHMETVGSLKAFAFDKTGTLTEGRPAVVEVVPLGTETTAQLLQLGAALEARSDHPLAQAIVAHAKVAGTPIASAKDFRMIPGKGATARFDGKAYWFGSHRYLEERGAETERVHETLTAMSHAGRTVVVIGADTHVCGFIALADAVRPEAREALQALRRTGVDHIVMLTGDNEGTARTIAKEVGIEEVYAELLPANKVSLIEALVAKYDTVAMVGDGVNDAPAMGRSTLGIAMGAAGSDAALEAADIALMSDDLARLPWLMHHSRRTRGTIRQNIGFSLAVKAAFVLLTLLGYATLWSAIAADMGASLLVIFNGLRLLNSASTCGGRI